MVWLSFPVSLTARGNSGLGVSVVFLAACWMITVLFPIYYGDLVNRRSAGPGLLLVCNLPSVLLWGVLFSLPLSIPENETP